MVLVVYIDILNLWPIVNKTSFQLASIRVIAAECRRIAVDVYRLICIDTWCGDVTKILPGPVVD